MARAALIVIMAIALAIAALKGPLKPFVPFCDQTSFGFCYTRR